MFKLDAIKQLIQLFRTKFSQMPTYGAMHTVEIHAVILILGTWLLCELTPFYCSTYTYDILVACFTTT
ncbi:hypothetical protein NTGBS_1180004 [Candidatus Nitrotoga sp. BS]|nr:hypothetical protein NTGBS_1180004 [Candidatus Nitrotoga sp. BS]